MKGINLLALTALASSSRDCPCGYTSTSSTFTEILETDFLHVSDFHSDWIAQVYNVTPTGSRGPYGKSAQLENVVSNPISSPYDWGGLGEHGPDPGLELWTRAELINIHGTDNGEMIPIAEIVSQRNDILYGSFRIGLKTTQVNGTCGAFFFYRNDSSEIDLEFLSSEPRGVNFVIQSPESVARGYVDHSSPDFDQHSLGFAPGEGYNEYRFDWLPERVDFYANGEILSTNTAHVPDSPGSIHLIHWSNGDEGWSGGPPERDAKMVVSYVKAYLNSSSRETTRESCQEGQRRCDIPNQEVSPDPGGIKGNDTGRTFFFTEEGTGEGDDSVIPTSVAGRMSMAWLGLFVVVVVLLL